MDIILLRTMTRKSLLSDGKYKGMTVGNIIDIQKTNYLRWIYFNMEGLTFTDDILDEISIWEKYRINKPGKNIELWDEINDRLHNPIYRGDPVKYFKMKSRSKKVQRTEQRRRNKMRKVEYKKSVLQARNHGR